MGRNILKNILIGAGTILSVWPSTNYDRFVPRGSPEDRMPAVWEQVGADIFEAAEQVSDGEIENIAPSRRPSTERE
jgi:hypothetical protein